MFIIGVVFLDFMNFSKLIYGAVLSAVLVGCGNRPVEYTPKALPPVENGNEREWKVYDEEGILRELLPEKPRYQDDRPFPLDPREVPDGGFERA